MELRTGLHLLQVEFDEIHREALELARQQNGRLGTPEEVAHQLGQVYTDSIVEPLVTKRVLELLWAGSDPSAFDSFTVFVLLHAGQSMQPAPPTPPETPLPALTASTRPGNAFETANFLLKQPGLAVLRELIAKRQDHAATGDAPASEPAPADQSPQ